MIFFTNKGKVYWHKVYSIPELRRDRRGRAIVNLLNLAEGEQIADCRAVRDFDKPDHYLVMATRRGLVKKTELVAYSRPKRHGIIAIKLREGDELVDVVVTRAGRRSGAGHRARHGDPLPRVGRPPDGPRLQRRQGHPAPRRRHGGRHGRGRSRGLPVDRLRQRLRQAHAVRAESRGRTPAAIAPEVLGDSRRYVDEDVDEADLESRGRSPGGGRRKRRQPLLAAFLPHAEPRRQRLHDIKTTERNGPVIGICRVRDNDELMMITARGKIQRAPGERHQHHRPQHPGRSDHEPRRRRHRGRRQARPQGGRRGRRGTLVSRFGMPSQRRGMLFDVWHAVVRVGDAHARWGREYLAFGSRDASCPCSTREEYSAGRSFLDPRRPHGNLVWHAVRPTRHLRVSTNTSISDKPRTPARASLAARRLSAGVSGAMASAVPRM